MGVRRWRACGVLLANVKKFRVICESLISNYMMRYNIYMTKGAEE